MFLYCKVKVFSVYLDKCTFHNTLEGPVWSLNSWISWGTVLKWGGLHASHTAGGLTHMASSMM